MTAEDFREALQALGWTHKEAARALGVASRARVGEWATGRRSPVPPYNAAHVRLRLAIQALLVRGYPDNPDDWRDDMKKLLRLGIDD